MKTFQEILTEVGQARGDVGDALQLLQAREGDLDQLMAHGKDRFQALHGAFTDFNQSIAAQSSRVVAASTKLTQSVADAQAALQRFGAAQAAEFDKLEAQFVAIGHEHDAAYGAIDSHEQAIGAHHDALDHLVDRSHQASQHAHDQFTSALDQLSDQFSSMMAHADQAVADHTAALHGHTDQVVQYELQQFASALGDAVKQTQQAIDTLQVHTGKVVNDEIHQLRDQLQGMKDKLQHTIEQLSHAVDKLEHTATSIATTLAHGSQAANKMMKVSNIGLSQVFHFIENLDKLCDEVIHAWA